MQMRLTRPLRRLLTGLALISALALVGCDRTAELIPGNADDPRTPPPTPSAEATPILVTPGLNVGAGGTPAAAIPDHELARSVVQVLGIDTSAGFEQIVRYGSGAVVDAEQRLILTSYAVVAPYRADGSRAYTSIEIAINDDPGAPATRTFTAEVAAADVDMGIAVLRVVGKVGDGGSVEVLELPAVVPGQATGINTGVPLRLFSHAGGSDGTDAVSVTNATVTGQRGEAGQTGRTWFKVDARLPAGASGGPAFDQSGALVGMLAQEIYVPLGEVGQVRPGNLLTTVIDRARSSSAAFNAPLHRGTTVAPDGIWVSRPAFAGNAVDSTGGRDLLDYGTRFNEGLAALYYEYSIVGAPTGASVEERWYLEGIVQDSLSSSYVWDQAGYGLISDRIQSPGAAGIPRGLWRVDVWVNGAQRASASVNIGGAVTASNTPTAIGVAGATTVTPEGNISIGAYATAPQLIAIFDLNGMGSVGRLQWVVFRDNQPVYTSPSIRWTEGDNARFWVGYLGDQPIQAGSWEFELHADGKVIGVGTISVF
ncbi:MAG: serine protease [Dehalococcoidia bacterium]|nr:serine protease [Dehalococcoidia bacterium]